MKKNESAKALNWELSEDGYTEIRPSFFWALITGLLFWVGLIGILLFVGISAVQAEESATSTNDPLVMKIYPDGTKMIVRWSEIGKAVDHGEKYGGAPRIVAYDPAKDGIVPIGEPSQKTASAATPAAVPSSSSVVSPDQPAKMDYTNADPKDFEADFGPTEGFVFRTAAGVAFQQPLSGRSGDGSNYQRLVFQPGIRYDIETQYNVTDWFRTGVETAFIYNQVHSFQFNNTMFYNNSTAFGNGGLFQVPILYSANFRFPSEGPVHGYVGGGVGANWNVLQLSAGGTRPYTSYHWNWAWQVTAGFTYCVAPGLDLDIGYKLLSSPNPNFADFGQFKASYNHSAQIGLAWRF